MPARTTLGSLMQQSLMTCGRLAYHHLSATHFNGHPGDLVLWDSRTVHGGIVGPGAKRNESKAGKTGKESDEHVELARMSVTVAMVRVALVQKKRSITLTIYKCFIFIVVNE